jgi:hypothetical protein
MHFTPGSGKGAELCVLSTQIDAIVLPCPALPCPPTCGCAGVEVSPGVFKDVPGELKHRTEYVYAHTPGGPPRECRRALATCAAAASRA